MIPAPIRIETTLAVSESNDKADGPTMNRIPRPYSASPWTTTGIDPLRKNLRVPSRERATRPSYPWLPPFSARVARLKSPTVSRPTAAVPQELSPRMFENPLLERLSRVHPAVPPLLYLPVVVFLLARAIVHEDLAPAAVAGVFLGGLATWSLAEYLLHR